MWIAVTDRLPTTETLVLVATDTDGYVMPAHWLRRHGEGYWHHYLYPDTMQVHVARVTHWMPMPAPPPRPERVAALGMLGHALTRAGDDRR